MTSDKPVQPLFVDDAHGELSPQWPHYQNGNTRSKGFQPGQFTAASLRQPDALQKIDKSGIRAKAVEGRVDPQSGELIGALFKGLVQQGQRLRVIAKSGVDPGDVDRGDVATLGDL